jgi:sulfate adenylyltransferase
LALELADGLFIQPLVGRKKRGDYTPESILTSYRTLIDDFLPSGRILLGVLSTAMRYAGPREALFHAIIRRNYGCTHFIVGRDHAGVGNYYEKYEAHELTRRFEGEVGIEILRMYGPFHCAVCDGIVTEQTCPHPLSMPQATREISGTDMRTILSGGGVCPPELMRPRVLESIRPLPIFITEDAD